jgi:uncharacterized lipoprotein YajG
MPQVKFVYNKMPVMKRLFLLMAVAAMAACSAETTASAEQTVGDYSL